jgi:hypothetical protein
MLNLTSPETIKSLVQVHWKLLIVPTINFKTAAVTKKNGAIINFILSIIIIMTTINLYLFHLNYQKFSV